MKSRKKLARLLAVLVASSMVLGSPNAVAFAEGNEISEESLSGNSPVEKASATPTEEKGQKELGDSKAEKTPAAEAESDCTCGAEDEGHAEDCPLYIAPEEREESEAVQAFLAALDQIMELQENDAEAEEVLAAVEKAKKLYRALSEEEKALDEVKIGYEAIEGFESVNPLEEVQDGTKEHPWLVSSEEELLEHTPANPPSKRVFIRLMKGFKITGDRYINGEFTLDLNGQELDAQDHYFYVNGGNLVVTGEGEISGTKSLFYVYFGTLSLQRGTFVATGSDPAIKMRAGTVTVGEDVEVRGVNGIEATYHSKLTVEGKVVSTGDYGIRVSDSNLTVTETGNVTAENGCGIENSETERGNQRYIYIYGDVKATGDNKDKDIAVKVGRTNGGYMFKVNVARNASIISENSTAILWQEDRGALNIESGTVEGKSGIEFCGSGYLNIKGADTKITGTNDKIEDPKNGRIFGAGIAISAPDESTRTDVTITVESGEIEGKCALYGSDYLTDNNFPIVELWGGKFTSTGKTMVERKGGEKQELYAIFKVPYATGTVKLQGGSYFGGNVHNNTYKDYYEDYINNQNYKVIAVTENWEKYYKVVAQTDDTDTVAEVTGIYLGQQTDRRVSYSTIQEAIEAELFNGYDNRIITLKKDVTENIIIDVPEKVTLNLNGHTIRGQNAKGAIAVNSSGNLTLKDSSEGGTGAVIGTGKGTAALYNNGGIVKVESGCIKREDNNAAGYYVVQNQSGEMEITGGSITNNSKSSSMVFNNGKMMISGGEMGKQIFNTLKNHLNGDLMITGDAHILGSIQLYGKAVIDGGLIEQGNVCVDSWTTDENSGNVTIKDGAVLNVGALRVRDLREYPECKQVGGTGKATLTITGGIITTTDGIDIAVYKNGGFDYGGVNKVNGTIDVTDGIFKFENDKKKTAFIAGYLTPKGLTLDENGKVVEGKKEVAETGGVNYSTLQEAIEAAGDGDTVTLLDNVTECVTVDKKITLDLDGFTLTNVDRKGNHTITVASGGNLTVNGPGTVDNVSHQGAAIQNEAGGFVQLNSGTYNRSEENGKTTESSGDNSWYTIVNRGEMVIGDGNEDDRDLTILQNGSFTSMVRNGLGTKMDDKTLTPEDTLIAKMTINGGYFNHGKINVKNEAYGEVTINGGKFNCDRWGLVNYGKAVVKGGVFEGENALIYNGVDDLAGADKAKCGELKVEGGDFTYSEDRYCISDYAPEKTWITGGTYNTQKVYYDEVNRRELTSAVMPNQYGAVLSNGRYTVKALQTSAEDNSGDGGSDNDGGSGSGSSGSGSSSGRRSSSRDEILNAGGASPMLIPVPQQPAVQMPAAPTPAATQPAAAAPEPLPAEEPAQLEDESVPLAEAGQEETKGREEPEKVINIGDEEVPMAAPSTSWAFLNLILMLVTAAGAIATVIGSVCRKGEEAEETGSTVWMIGLIPAICSTAMFVLTEKIGGSIAIADRWTVAMLLIALVEGAVVFFVYRMMNKAHNRA